MPIVISTQGRAIENTTVKGGKDIEIQMQRNVLSAWRAGWRVSEICVRYLVSQEIVSKIVNSDIAASKYTERGVYQLEKELSTQPKTQSQEEISQYLTEMARRTRCPHCKLEFVVFSFSYDVRCTGCRSVFSMSTKVRKNAK
ncbi:MAG: hypothetical protein HN929_06095 [Chloroflexi bacterium]|jgi:ribosomal protein S27E|nr:hypothetical protein [Chloroflexota bacterium]